MKKLILTLILGLLFLAGNSFAATIKCIMYATENNGTEGTLAGNAGPAITSDYTFTIETDGSGNVTNFTDLWTDYFYTFKAGGYDPRDGGVFDANEQVFPNGVQQSVATVKYTGTPDSSHGLWFYGQSNPTGPLSGVVFKVGLLEMNYNSGTDVGIAGFGPNSGLEEKYQFHKSPSSLTISKPNGGEILVKGVDYTITWDSTSITGTVEIDLYKGGTASGNKLSEIAAAAENNGSYIFNPDVSLVTGSDYYIGISAEGGTVTDFSNAAFTIQDTAPSPSLTILKPNGGEHMPKGVDYTITWDSTSITGTVEIDLYKGGTASENNVSEIAAAAVNNGSYIFNPAVSLETGSDYYIGISAEGGTVTDFSDSAFTIWDDADNDGVTDAIDHCPNTPLGETVNSEGCSVSQLNSTCLSTKVKEAGNLGKAMVACRLKEMKDSKDIFDFDSCIGKAKDKSELKWENAENKTVKGVKVTCYTDSFADISGLIDSKLAEIYAEIVPDPSKLLSNKNFNQLACNLLTAASNRYVSLLNAESTYFQTRAKNKNAQTILDKATFKATTTFNSAWSNALVKAGKAKNPIVDPSDISRLSDLNTIRDAISDIIDNLVYDIINM